MSASVCIYSTSGHLFPSHHHLRYVVPPHDDWSKSSLSASQSQRAKNEAVLRQRVRSREKTEVKHRVEVRSVGSREAERMSY